MLIKWHFADEGESSTVKLEATTTVIGDDPIKLQGNTVYRMGCLNVLGALDDANIKEAWDFLLELYTWQQRGIDAPPEREIHPRYIDVAGVDRVEGQPPSFRIE